MKKPAGQEPAGRVLADDALTDPARRQVFGGVLGPETKKAGQLAQAGHPPPGRVELFKLFQAANAISHSFFILLYERTICQIAAGSRSLTGPDADLTCLPAELRWSNVLYNLARRPPMLIDALFWFVLALVFAAVEVEIEGRNGWAEKLPTWYRTTGFWARLYGLVMRGKPLTGYHLFMFFLPLLAMHSGFFLGLAPTLAAELEVLAIYAFWVSLWITSGSSSIPPMAPPVSAGTRSGGTPKPLDPRAFPAGICALGNAIAAPGRRRGSSRRRRWRVHLASPAPGLPAPPSGAGHRLPRSRYRRWHARMRRRDERDQAGIFH